MTPSFLTDMEQDDSQFQNETSQSSVAISTDHEPIEKTIRKVETIEQFSKEEKRSGCLAEKPPLESYQEIKIPPGKITLHTLLDIIHHHTPTGCTTYNINLSALHCIRTELEQLHAMIGLHTFKDAVVNQLLYFVQQLHISEVHFEGDYRHTVLYGPPGTGKTEIAKLLGNMYAKLDVFNQTTLEDTKPRIPKFRKVTRHDLVAGYLGQTAIKTNKVIEECLGGCLFIDEAYSLGNSDSNSSDSYSQECIDTLCEALSNHKQCLMVIIAGYEDSIRRNFFAANPGLDSRFVWRFYLDEYTDKEMYEIFCKKVQDHRWKLCDQFQSTWFETKKQTFVNQGRDMETLVSYAKIAHGRRIFGETCSSQRMLITEDVNEGYQSFLTHLSRRGSQETPFGMYI